MLFRSEAGIEVVPFYFSIFPVELEIEKRIVGFYEDFFKTDVHVYPHPCCYEIFTELLFMGPAQVRVMELIGVRDVRSMKWIDSHASESLNPGGFTVYGLKKSDSFNRACVLNKGHINTKLRKAYPMAYCGDRAVFSLLQAHGCPLPDCYAEIGESLDSFRIPTMDYIRRKSPSDWETIKQLQPLIELEYARQRISTRH